MQVVTNWSSLLGKTHQILESLLRVNFYTFLNDLIFPDFWKSSIAQANILFYIKMVGKTQWFLISLVCDENFFTTAAHIRFNEKVSKIILTAFCLFLFLISKAEELRPIVINNR